MYIMSVWIETKKEMPPLDEEVLILYKDKKDELKEENLFYGIASRRIFKIFSGSDGYEDWSKFTEYQGYYEVVYWARLYDMPRIKNK